MVEALGITIDRRPKGRPRRRKNYRKIGCVFKIKDSAIIFMKVGKFAYV